MEIALKMEQKMDSNEHAPNSLSAEYAYFDGSTVESGDIKH